MGVYCCKDKHEFELSSETDTSNQNNYGDTYTSNHGDIFKTRPPCMYGHQCSCPCHQGGKCLFRIKSKYIVYLVFFVHTTSLGSSYYQPR